MATNRSRLFAFFECNQNITMKVPVYLMVTFLALINTQTSEGTFHRRNKNKGPFGHLASLGSTALDGFLRYAPDFYDVVPKIANKFLTNSKKQNNYYYDNDEHHGQGYSVFDGAKRTVKRISRFLTKPHVGHVVPVHLAQNNYGLGYEAHGYKGHDFGFEEYGHLPHSYPSFTHSGFDELPVHGVFRNTIDFGNSLGQDFSSLHHFEDSYHL